MSLELLLKSFRLPAFAEHHRAFAKRAEEKGWGFLEYLRYLDYYASVIVVTSQM